MRIDDLIATLLGTFGFAVLFRAPRKEYIFCVLAGAIAWLGYTLSIALTPGEASATLVAAFFLTVSSRAFSAIRRCPSTIFLMPGLIPLVNGLGIYQAANYLINGDVTNGVSTGLASITIAAAIALGIVFGFALPQPWFNRIGRLNKK